MGVQTELQGTKRTVQRTQTSTTIIKEGLPLTVLQFEGSMLDPLLKELIKLLPRGDIKSLTVHFLGYVSAFHKR